MDDGQRAIDSEFQRIVDTELIGLLDQIEAEMVPVLDDVDHGVDHDSCSTCSMLNIAYGMVCEALAIVASTAPDDYQAGAEWLGALRIIVLPVLQNVGIREVMRRTGRGRSAVYDVLGGRTKGTGAPMMKYREVAIEEAGIRLRAAGLPVPRHPYGVLFRARSLET